MSTSSSSECSCVYCHYANYNYGAARTPFYPTMGEPLVYYAQVRKGTSRESRRGNPNCFVKAFRWYTQERCGSQKMGSPNSRMDPDVANFATWLDSKYKEFVREGRPDQNYRNTQTLIPADDVIINDAFCETCTPQCGKKRFAALRSPWKKRRSANKKDSRDLCGCESANKSLEYIMAPKNLQCPASECRHQPCYSESQVSKKITVTSQSMTSICQNKEIYYTVIEPITQDGDKIRDNSNIKKPTNKRSVVKTVQKPKKVPSKIKRNEVSCQCINTSVNSQSQYESSDMKSKVDLVCSICKPVKEFPCPASQPVSRKQSETNQVADSVAPTVSTNINKSNIPLNNNLCMNCKCPAFYENGILCCGNRICSTVESTWQQFVPVSRPVEKIPSVCVTCTQRPCVDGTVYLKVNNSNATTYSPQIITINNTVQTSDHSIILGDDCYPLFMKIVFADKLHEEVKK